ncbi:MULTISPECIES: hypothetical protein [Heyndrickxia]|nr:hypothetical protein [Weizmannia sp. CD-2023]MEC2223461.1 hypothetical protein [Weizmannia sp. CD-2023]
MRQYKAQSKKKHNIFKQQAWQLCDLPMDTDMTNGKQSKPLSAHCPAVFPVSGFRGTGHCYQLNNL